MNWQVEVSISGTDEKDVKSIDTKTPQKVLPPWMIREGMNLTREQRGESSEQAKMANSSIASELTDDKKSTVIENKESIQVLPTAYLTLKFFHFIILCQLVRRLTLFWCFVG